MSSPPQVSDIAFDSRKIVRRVSGEDVEAVMELAKRIPMVSQWSRAEYQTYCAIGQQTETQAKAMFVACVSAQDYTTHPWEEVVGFAAFSAIPHVGNGECELENMAVAERWRRHGIALRLLAAGRLWCRSWCPAGPDGAPPDCDLSLEVRANNLDAIAFYERAGFKANGRRPAYYRQPDDDAVLMWKSLVAVVETR